MTHCLGVIEAIKANQLHGNRTKKRVLLSKKGRVSVYKKESVRWPESEGAGKVTRYQWWAGLELRPGMPGISPELVPRIPDTGTLDYIPGGDECYSRLCRIDSRNACLTRQIFEIYVELEMKCSSGVDFEPLSVCVQRQIYIAPNTFLPVTLYSTKYIPSSPKSTTFLVRLGLRPRPHSDEIVYTLECQFQSVII